MTQPLVQFAQDLRRLRQPEVRLPTRHMTSAAICSRLRPPQRRARSGCTNAAMAVAMAKLCNAAARSKPGCAARKGLVQRCLGGVASKGRCLGRQLPKEQARHERASLRGAGYKGLISSRRQPFL
jgi:hypothetical protein